ncbi:MAG: tetratricopeptide repeat protein [Planctomycetes bacterium]|nr:tetratricopeptide repeat protein [Planctomycetota bacterium]
MSELRLFLERSGATLQVRLGSNGGLGKPLPFQPFLTDDDFEDLRWYLEDFMDLPDGGALVRAERVERAMEDWGRRLFDAVFKDGDNREFLLQLRREPEPRLLTLATRDIEALRQPWEMMADERGPLIRQGITIRRQLETAGKPVEFQTGLPLRVLLVVSRPGDTGFIDPRLTSRSILEALTPLGAHVKLDFCRPPTLPRMDEMLHEAKRRHQPYHIVHFEGHGVFLPEVEIGALCFEKPDAPGAALAEAKTDFVRADRLGDLLAAHAIPLVILEACRTGQLGKVAVFRAVAPRLIQAGVGSVLSMSHAVHVQAAHILLKRFYHELVAGVTVGQALEQGRAALMANPGRWLERGPVAREVTLKDWFLPHLYQCGADLQLVPAGLASTVPSSVGEEEAKEFDVFLSHAHADSARVEGIATRLHEKHGLRVWLDKWACGPGPLHPQCRDGVSKSRFVLIVCSSAALASAWVAAEIEMAHALDPRGRNLIPLKMEAVELPLDLRALLWVDFLDPAQDAANTGKVAAMIGPRTSTPGAVGAADDGKTAPPRSAGRSVAARGDEAGAFPRPPVYGFHGRAHELYDLEGHFRRHRAIMVHAMGGMGKTSLATEAAHWWTRTGLFPDGACFVSFEQFATADRVVQVLGSYLEGVAFSSHPIDEQFRRAKEYFHTRSVLMVWDNFESVLPKFNERPRLPGTGAASPGADGGGASVYSEEERRRVLDLFRDWTEAEDGLGRLLVTIRPEDSGLLGACKVELRGLARPDSLGLLVRVLEKAGVDLQKRGLTRETLGPLLAMLADHPLSIELVGPHLNKLTPDAIMADFGRLLAEFQRGEGQERNDSLLASLAFSTRRLSPAAQAALPWLGLFSGGVFEDNLLDVSGIPPAEWEAARAEMEATALLRVERDIQLNDRPYLRFHPTLAYAASAAAVANPEEARKRFIEVYLGVMQAVDHAMSGAQPRAGLEVMAREEINFRTSVRLAVDDHAFDLAGALGDTFQQYLAMSGRLRERDAWVTWLAAEVRKGGFSQAAVVHDRQEAFALIAQGRPQEGIQRLVALLQRLRQTTEFEAAFQLAATAVTLGRALLQCGLSEQAVPVLREAVQQWEALVATAEESEARPRRGNLAATLGDLANALRETGQLAEALLVSERALELNRELGDERSVAAGHGRCAEILATQGRYREADSRYDTGLAASQRAGDKELVATTLQHQGDLADKVGQLERASALYNRALELFQEMHDEGGEMLTCNLLGVVEQKASRLSEARSWYERSRELAERLGNRASVGVAAQNIGIVCQMEGEAAQKRGDEKTATARFREALRFITQSLQVSVETQNQPRQASSHFQLSKVYRLLNDLDAAERHAHQGREICERLGSNDVHLDYHNLAQIAHARGDAAQAADWERKRDAAAAAQEQRAQGAGGLPAQFVQAVQALALDCARAGFDEAQPAPLPPDAEAALAQLDKFPAPMPDLAAFLRRLAAREVPALPAPLPPELTALLTQLLDAVKEAGK